MLTGASRCVDSQSDKIGEERDVQTQTQTNGIKDASYVQLLGDLTECGILPKRKCH